jgi:thioredoxin reductase (NADPH)
LAFDNGYSVLSLDGGETLSARCVLIATGADYRRLALDGCDRLEGCGVYYAATLNEAELCGGADVVVVGGGNSAGQAVVFLSSRVHKVFLLIRGVDLYANMSSYLAERIEQTANVELFRNTTVQRMFGDKCLRSVEVVSSQTGQARIIETPALFSFIGAVPRTDWLPAQIERDSKDFVRTGASLAEASQWTAQRAPYLLETSRPGVFAAGDVRSGSIKRVASAVGEGSTAVQFVHEYLKEK